MTQLTIFHNPNCSKSRGAIALLEKNKINFIIIDYLTNTPTHEQLTQIITAGVPAKELVRAQEQEWIQLNIDLSKSSTQEIVQAIMSYPKIMQRPIILYNGRAIIARPPEKLLELI